jgi:L-alanine-DL-glutamate epimerase-like enolase superfamily enzyme
MKIAQLRLWQVSGPASFGEDFWAERLVRPIDVYPEHRAEGIEIFLGPEAARASAIFVELETDDGATGMGGPISLEEAFVIDRDLRHLIIGADALANERLWDRMYRYMVHGRKGVAMFAISAVDIAMWDLKGRVANLPVHRLLGGPTRPAIRAYASALGFSLEPDRIAATARRFVEDGYTAMKWFYRSGPADGERGMEANEAVVAAARAAAGPGVEIMTDAWMAWDVPYTLAMARRLEPHRVRWIEEPVLPDQVAGYAEIRRASPVPIAGGEHEYTRWGIHGLLEAGAVDVLQPDVAWAGGITEMLKVCALASTYGIPVVPHGHSVPATIHLVAALPESVTPLLEYLVKWNEVHQFFLREQVRPENGWVAVPEKPGLGIELDESKIETRRELHWSDA